jgi:multiple sugar transport system ATP-binding protein
MSTVELKRVRKDYAGHEVIKGVDLTVMDRELVVFVGPSGSGKSTLIRMIAGLEEISDGDLLIDGALMNEVPPHERGISMVFQSYALYPHMTVAENMALALKLQGVPKAERDSKVLEAARALQLEPLLERTPKQLSGGQRQRVAIGRAIVRDPKLFLFDEPLSNLDASLRMQMRLEIARLHRTLNATMIYVTHDQIEAMTLADRIVVLNGGQVEQVGTPMELYHTPCNLFVAGFIGSPKMNLLSAEVTGTSGSTATLKLEGGGAIVSGAAGPVGSRVTAGIRAEHLTVDPSGTIPGRIETIENLGDTLILYVDIGTSELLRVKTSPAHPFAIDDRITLSAKPGDVHLFDAEGLAITGAKEN